MGCHKGTFLLSSGITHPLRATVEEFAALIRRQTLMRKQRTVQQLLDQLRTSERDRFAANLYQSRRECRHVCDVRAREASKLTLWLT